MSARYTLAIHTSSPDLGLSISDGAGETRHQVWHLGREQSNLMHHHLETFLAPQTWTDLSALAVAIGPGGFTGTRIGVVLARTLAQQLQIPLFGVSSLAAIAQQAVDHSRDRVIAVQMPAQRGQLFTGIYQFDRSSGLLDFASRTPSELGGANFSQVAPRANRVTVLQADAVMTEAEWQSTLARVEHPYHLIKAEPNQGHYVAGVLELAQRSHLAGHQPSWSDVLPFYGQHPVE